MRKFLTVLLSLMMVVTMMPVMTGVAFATDAQSNWSKLAKAMAGEVQTTVDGVFSVKDETDFSSKSFSKIRTITLLSDIKVAEGDTFLSVTSGTNIILDLNGHTIDRGLTSPMTSGYVISVAGKLTMEDSSTDKIGAITGGNCGDSGGGISVAKGGTFNMKGGNIKNNCAGTTGGGVFVYGGGQFFMSGGNIINNTAQNGGGVFVTTDGIANLAGGTISNNNVYQNGGGVVEGGKITLGGTVVIDGNTSGGGKTANNLFLGRNKIEISTETTPTDMRIGVTTMGTPSVDKSVEFTTNGTEDDVKYFFADKEDEYVAFKQGHLELCKVPDDNYKINIAYSENGTVTADKQFTTPSDIVTLTVEPDEGYELGTLTVAKNTSPTDIKTTRTDLTTATNFVFEMPDENVTVTATFIEKETEKTTPSDLKPLLVAAGVTATTAAVITTGVVVGKAVKNAVDEKKAKAEAEKEPAPQEPTVQEEPKPTEPTTPTLTANQVKEVVDGLTIRCNTKKTEDGTKVYAKVTDGDLEALEAAGYTVNYKFYRSKYAKKSYKLMKTTAKANYTNTKGTDGKMYYYKAKVVVTDKDGNEVAITAIKDCKYGNRKF